MTDPCFSLSLNDCTSEPKCRTQRQQAVNMIRQFIVRLVMWARKWTGLGDKSWRGAGLLAGKLGLGLGQDRWKPGAETLAGSWTKQTRGNSEGIQAERCPETESWAEPKAKVEGMTLRSSQSQCILSSVCEEFHMLIAWTEKAVCPSQDNSQLVVGPRVTEPDTLRSTTRSLSPWAVWLFSYLKMNLKWANLLKLIFNFLRTFQ